MQIATFRRGRGYMMYAAVALRRACSMQLTVRQTCLSVRVWGHWWRPSRGGKGWIGRLGASRRGDHVRHMLSDAQRVQKRGERIVGWWLLGCCGMVGGAVLLGGVTRLTESGLSMTQWHLIRGMRPPRSEEEWEEEFQRYKQFPEYKYVHRDLTLDGFKRIFYMEYAHRMWGRATGLLFFLPPVYFWAKGWVGRALKPRLVIYAGLVLFQGLLGWWMVKSGLNKEAVSQEEIPRVSQYRLAAHLSTALILYSSMLYNALGLLLPPMLQTPSPKLKTLRHLAHGSVALVFLTAFSGAFVAGLDAGLVYNSFPKMGGQWIPEDLFAMSPRLKNITENPTTTQFDHRLLAISTLAFLLGTWAMARGVALTPRARLATNCLAGVAFVQVGLGVATLLYYVPTTLAASHQSGAVALLSVALWLMHELRKKLP